MNGHLKEKLNSSRVVSSTANLRRKSTWQEKQIIATSLVMLEKNLEHQFKRY